ncbi:hypothetical protein M0802_012613 [Mischocyttarus mexicanus]|nr:hypothetical protein M0802_012613 [Mischocyttarus mexicanus]
MVLILTKRRGLRLKDEGRRGVGEVREKGLRKTGKERLNIEFFSSNDDGGSSSSSGDGYGDYREASKS